MIVPCLNAAETVGELFESLGAQRWHGDWEVIFADNGSTDASVEVVQEYRDDVPRLQILDASERGGQPFACNHGARAAKGRSLVFVDADDRVAEGWLDALGNALRRHLFVASRHDFTRLNPPGQSIRQGVQDRQLQRLWYSPHLLHAGGCGMGIRRSLFLDVGGFDEDLPNLHDTDLCIRVQRRGVPLRLVREACVHVRERPDPTGTFRQARRWARVNMRLYRRHRITAADPVECWQRYLRGWRRIWNRILRMGDSATTGERKALAWKLGWHLGLLEGALRYRVAPVVKGVGASEPNRSRTDPQLQRGSR